MENISSVDRNRCTGCAACVGCCPKDAIVMKPSNQGFLYPEVNTDACISCGKCVITCPIHQMQKHQQDREVYAVSLKNGEVKRNSSSGGAFSWIAEYILKEGGVVYGAAADERGNIRHIRAKGTDDLQKIRGSKYAQSDIADCYRQIGEDLRSRTVLVSGTPCQIAGVKSVFGGHKNLITCDVLCFGVPSPLVFRQYLDETVGADPVKYLNMRSKVNGWKNYSMDIKTSAKQYSKSKGDDLFLRGFLTKLFVRNSCCTCQYHDINRVGDFSLGDYWGFQETFQKNCVRDDDTGISFVMVNSKKAKQLFASLDKKQVQMERRNIAGETLNWALQPSTIHSNGSNQFWEKFFAEGYTAAITPFLKPYAKKTYWTRLKETISGYYWVRFLKYKIGR